MTRLIYDKFSKDYLDILLRDYGRVDVAKEISGEIREIDCYFVPNSPTLPPELGILGQLAATTCLFEIYRNAVGIQQIRDCLLKLLIMSAQVHREAKRNQESVSDSDLPRLWIITPTASDDVLQHFGATVPPNSISGINYLATGLKTALVVVHDLPCNQDTLWLRLLGTKQVQKQAIDELVNLPDNHPLKSAILEILYTLQKNLEINQKNKLQEDRELIMLLEPLYREDRAKAIEEGREEGREQGVALGKKEEGMSLILRQLTRKFGNINAEQNQQITQLSVEKLETLGEALLDFNNPQDLTDWLRDNS